MSNADEALARVTSTLPPKLADLLGEIGPDATRRELVLYKSIEQRAHLLCVEIARAMLRLHVPLPVIPPVLDKESDGENS